MWGKHTKSTTNAPKNHKDETAIRQGTKTTQAILF